MNTQKRKSLDYIANSFRAADKIRNLQKEALSQSQTRSVLPSNPEVIRQVLEIIAQHSPDPSRSTLTETLNKASLYSESYHNLKQQIHSTRSQGFNSEHLVKTLSVVRPIVAEKQRSFIDKIIKIHEILNS